jgi:2-polyprenyl-3-methyl-5-hydroxy-6-metoxy-1,4-benzoquinol methylase
VPASTIELNFPTELARSFPREFPIAWRAYEEVSAVIRGVDFSALSRRSPALEGYAWDNYLRCSVVRAVRVLKAVHSLPDSVRVLDVGSYFGNFALMCQMAGCEVEAVDSYEDYGNCFDGVLDVLRRAGVVVHRQNGFDLDALPESVYDAVICAGVIEHIPHTPRLLLETLRARLRRGGLLVLDTPNVAYLYNRQRLMRGESIFYPLAAQYETQVPFEGHHREYTVAEVQWMFERLQLENISIDTFNYSIYGATRLTGVDADNYRMMEQDPTARELIFATGRKR